MRLDRLDTGRGLWLDVSARALQVFIASLLVELAVPDFLAFRVGFWQDVAIAAITSAIAQGLALAASYRRAADPPESAAGTRQPAASVPADAEPHDHASSSPDGLGPV